MAKVISMIEWSHERCLALLKKMDATDDIWLKSRLLAQYSSMMLKHTEHFKNVARLYQENFDDRYSAAQNDRG
jgi:hypothetical protein